MSNKRNVIIIRNFRPFPPISPEENHRKWMYLQGEIVAIFNSQNYPNSLESLYKIVTDLYSQGYSPLLQNLQVLIENYLRQQLEVMLTKNGKILENIVDFWREFCDHIRTIKNIFLYYDRSPKFFKYNTVQSMSLNLFTSIILQEAQIKESLICEVLAEIEMDRNGGPIRRDLLKSITEMLNILQIYEDFLQGPLLDASDTFYDAEGVKILQNCCVPEYLAFVNQRIYEELQRSQQYLNKCTENLLLEIVHKNLVEKHINEILSKGFDALIDDLMIKELILIYKLLQKTANGNKYLVAYFKDYIVKKGQTITEPQNDKNRIQDLLDFKDNLDNLIEIAFENRKDFHECLRMAFQHFINSPHAKVAQLLAKYIDLKLRCKEISDEDLEVILNKVLKLFKHIQGKDIFEAFYKKLLAKRLLLGKSANQDAENSMISKLKEECGSVFTSNIEGMFQDINLSRNINVSFKQKLKHQQTIGLNSEFSVNVLTSSYWPNYPNHNVNLPMDLVVFQQHFERFYLANHNGRKLLWQPSLSHCLIRANFECGTKELQASLFQTLVLLSFNSGDEFGFTEIEEATNLELWELKRTLLSLIGSKARILLKNPKGKEIEPETLFVLNGKFTDKLFRVKINQLQMQESMEEEKETERNVLVDRQFQIDAAIVRIMKSKKTIKHNLLVRELYNVLDIPVSQSDLKKRIELLIEREYMERDRENKSTYIYIA